MQEKILNQDNIISVVSRVALRTQKSEKSGNYFTILTLRFKNGLEIDYFVDKKINLVLWMLSNQFYNLIKSKIS